MQERKNTAYRLKQIMNDRKLKQVDILRIVAPYCKEYDIKLGKNDLSQYVSGKTAPGQYKLFVLAKALNVSEAWLMGYDVPMEREKEKKSNQSKEVSDEDIMFALFGGKVSDETFNEVKRFAAYIKDKDNNE